jgi:hypothetical protein
MVAGVAAVIRIDAIWLATEPIDMRAGVDTILARVVKAFGAARPHHAYLFANRHSTRLKVLVYDGFGIWLAARRVNKGQFIWTNGEQAIAAAMNPEQLRALVTGLPWQTLTHDYVLAERPVQFVERVVLPLAAPAPLSQRRIIDRVKMREMRRILDLKFVHSR